MIFSKEWLIIPLESLPKQGTVVGVTTFVVRLEDSWTLKVWIPIFFNSISKTWAHSLKASAINAQDWYVMTSSNPTIKGKVITWFKKKNKMHPKIAGAIKVMSVAKSAKLGEI